MIEKVNQTFFTGVLNAVLNFLTVWVTAKYLGEAGRGDIALFTLNLSFIQIFTAIVGSSAIIYLQSRYNLGSILLISSLWAVGISAVGSLVMEWLEILQAGRLWTTFLVTAFQSLSINCTLLLLGKNKTPLYNLCRVSQPLLVIVIIAVEWSFSIVNVTVSSFIDVLVFSSFVSFLVSFLLIITSFNVNGLQDIKEAFVSFFKIGVVNQLTNFVQLVNYRFSYYLLASYWGSKELGIFSLGVALVEGIWIFKNSLALLHHSEVSNEKNINYQTLLKNKKLMILSFIVTASLILVALAIPLKIYLLIFGQGFEAIKEVIFYISPGILSIAVSTIIAYFFSGIGLVKYNTYSSTHGLIVILVTGSFLIPQWGLKGAAISNACSYVASSISLFYYYSRYLRVASKP